MTLAQKLLKLQKFYPEIYEVICNNLPDLVKKPSSPTAEDLAKYNSYLNVITDDVYYQLVV